MELLKAQHARHKRDWPKITVGMSEKEVQNILGPFIPEYKGMTVMVRPDGSTYMTSNAKYSCGNGCAVEFVDGKLLKGTLSDDWARHLR
jgi:hypothetical protein